MLTDKYRVVKRSTELMDVAVDNGVLTSVLEEFREEIQNSETDNVSAAVDEAFVLLRSGMSPIGVGVGREPNVCGECQLPLLNEVRNGKVTICPFCNCWLHGWHG